MTVYNNIERGIRDQLIDYACEKLAEQVYRAWTMPEEGESFEKWRERATMLERIPPYMSRNKLYELTAQHARAIYKGLLEEMETEGGDND